MAVIITFYVVAILVILGISYGLFKIIKKHNVFLAVSVSLLTLLILILIFPMPISHGFMTFGEILYHEIEDEWKLRKKTREIKNNNKVVNERFFGALDFTFKRKLFGSLQVVEIPTEPRVTVFYETNSKMLFSDWVQEKTEKGLLPLNDAKRKCHEIQPMGYWDLVTEAENLLVIKTEENLPFFTTNKSMVTQLIDTDFGFSQPVYFLERMNNSNKKVDTGTNDFVFRCVARSIHAPTGGYSSNDIALADWNDFQMTKGKRQK